jgi:uncharacterized protein
MATNAGAFPKLSLPIVGMGMFGMALSWILTPNYGPWMANAVTATPILLAALVWGETARNLQLSRSALVSSIAVGFAVLLLSWLAVPLATRVFPSVGAEIRQLYSILNRPPGPLRALPILLLTAATEEVVWRGELVAWLQKRTGAGVTVAIATLSYSLPIAASQSMLLFAVGNALGVVFTLLRLLTGSWTAPLLAHVIWALGVFVIRPISV